VAQPAQLAAVCGTTLGAGFSALVAFCSGVHELAAAGTEVHA